MKVKKPDAVLAGRWNETIRDAAEEGGGAAIFHQLQEPIDRADLTSVLDSSSTAYGSEC